MTFFILFLNILLFTQCVKEVRSSEDVTTTSVRPVDLMEQCIEKSNVNRDLVEKLKAGNIKSSDKNLKKWVLCYFMKTGVMSADGVLRQDVVLKDIPDSDKIKIEKVINKCLYKKRHPSADTAWHYLTCFRAKEPKFSKIANNI